MADPAPAPRLVHPVTLSFADGALERAFAAHTFMESYSLFVATFIVFATLFGLVVIATPASWPVAAAPACTAVAGLGLRAWLHGFADQARAHSRFSWGMATTIVIERAVLL